MLHIELDYINILELNIRYPFVSIRCMSNIYIYIYIIYTFYISKYIHICILFDDFNDRL